MINILLVPTWQVSSRCVPSQLGSPADQEEAEPERSDHQRWDQCGQERRKGGRVPSKAKIGHGIGRRRGRISS